MQKEIQKIDKLLVKHFGIPKRKETLPDAVDILIGTILSQNTNDNNSYKAYLNLKEKYPNWADVAALPLERLEEVIRVAGLGKQKSKAIKAVLQSLLNENKSISLEHLRKLPMAESVKALTGYNGVGVKTASCVLLFSFDMNVCPVDTHVHRVLNRIGLVSTKTPEKTFQLINEDLPDGIGHRFHTNLIKLGRSLCKPSSVHCSLCPLKRICSYEAKDDQKFSKPKKVNDFLLLDSI